MNGIKYIREKSNISKNSLAERMGVTRQTVTLWENGSRKPDARHLKWLCDFYGLSGKWFGELSEEDLSEIGKKTLYCHNENGKQFYTFIPSEGDGSRELGFSCEDLDVMLDEKDAETVKRSKDLLKRVDRYLKLDNEKDAYLCDKITTADRGIADIERFLDLMGTVKKAGTEGTFLKVPLRYEIKTVLYAMMIATGQISPGEVMAANEDDFSQDGVVHIDLDYFSELIKMMEKHWKESKEKAITAKRRR